MKTAPNEHWSAELIRIGNSAVREAQQRNRQLGIPNWYSLNGVLVSDASREDSLGGSESRQFEVAPVPTR